MAAGQHEHPHIKGDWMQADESANHLELAPTDREGVYAVRDSFTPGDVLFATGNQLLKLAQAVQQGKMSTLIGQ